MLVVPACSDEGGTTPAPVAPDESNSELVADAHRAGGVPLSPLEAWEERVRDDPVGASRDFLAVEPGSVSLNRVARRSVTAAIGSALRDTAHVAAIIDEAGGIVFDQGGDRVARSRALAMLSELDTDAARRVLIDATVARKSLFRRDLGLQSELVRALGASSLAESEVREVLSLDETESTCAVLERAVECGLWADVVPLLVHVEPAVRAAAARALVSPNGLGPETAAAVHASFLQAEALPGADAPVALGSLTHAEASVFSTTRILRRSEGGRSVLREWAASSASEAAAVGDYALIALAESSADASLLPRVVELARSGRSWHLRSVATAAIGELGSESELPLLRELQRDTHVEPSLHGEYFPIRGAADAAIESILERVSHGR